MPPKVEPKKAQKGIEEKYKKHELRDHIYTLPDTYIGSVEKPLLILTCITIEPTDGKERNYLCSRSL